MQSVMSSDEHAAKPFLEQIAHQNKIAKLLFVREPGGACKAVRSRQEPGNEAVADGNWGRHVKKKVTLKVRSCQQTQEESRVVRAGIEPATHGFSVHCSTN